MIWLLVSSASAQEPAPNPSLAPLPPMTAEVKAFRDATEAWLVEGGVAPEEAPVMAAAMVGFEEGITWQRGVVSLEGGAVSLALGEGDRYANPAETSRILETWGNPPDPDTLGLWLPADSHLFGPGSWAVLLRLDQDGWVDDADAASIDYEELLTSMKEGERAAGEERRKAGLDGLELVGWAEAPHYDAGSKVLYWATVIRSDAGNETLNYDVRVLGRKGVLSLNALSTPTLLPEVKEGMERIRGLARFEDGHRYADYVPGVDNKAAYGLAALVAGGAVAAKTGMFKGLLALLFASKKLLLAGGVAAVAGVRAVWGRISGRKPTDG
jgi:uncharacterized membrane-anchored protein